MYYTVDELHTFFASHEHASLGWNRQEQKPFWPLLMHPEKTNIQLSWLNPTGVRIILSYPEGKAWLQSRIEHDYTAYLLNAPTLSAIVQCTDMATTKTMLLPIKKNLLLSRHLQTSRYGKLLWNDPWTLRLIAEYSTPSSWVKNFHNMFDSYVKMLKPHTGRGYDGGDYYINHDPQPTLEQFLNNITNPTFMMDYPKHGRSLMVELCNTMESPKWKTAWRTLYDSGLIDDWIIPPELKGALAKCWGVDVDFFIRDSCTPADVALQEFSHQGYPINDRTSSMLNIFNKKRASDAFARECGLSFVEHHINDEKNDIAKREFCFLLHDIQLYSVEQYQRIRTLLKMPIMEQALYVPYWDQVDDNASQNSIPIPDHALFLESVPEHFWKYRLNQLIQLLMDDNPENPLSSVTSYESNFVDTWRTLVNTHIPPSIMNALSSARISDAVFSVLLHHSGLSCPYDEFCIRLNDYVQTAKALDMPLKAEQLMLNSFASAIELGDDHFHLV